MERGDFLSFEEAHTRAEQEDNTALALWFTEDGPFVGFDLDDVTVDGEFIDEVLGIVRRLSSYTEVLSSGQGLPAIVEGTTRSKTLFVPFTQDSK